MSGWIVSGAQDRRKLRDPNIRVIQLRVSQKLENLFTSRQTVNV